MTLKSQEPPPTCRLLVLERFARQRARLGHITGFEEPGVEELVLADLCRRTGQYDGAARWVDQGMARQPQEIVRRGLEMEFSLAQQKDRGTHSLEELLQLRTHLRLSEKHETLHCRDYFTTLPPIS